MAQMFRYLTGILEREDRKRWKLYSVLCLFSPVVDIFSFSVILYIINAAVKANGASPQLIAFTLLMVLVSVLKCVFELYKSRLSTRLVYDGAQKLSTKIYELFLQEDLAAHNQKSAMQMLTMVRTDTNSCIQVLADGIGVCVNGLTMAGYAALLIYASGWAGLASVVLLLALMGAVFFWSRARMIAYGEKYRSYEVKANSQITIAYGVFKELKLGARLDAVLQKYRSASFNFAQIQGNFRYSVLCVGVILQNLILAALFIVLAVILAAGTNPAAVLAPMMVYLTALVRMLPTAYAILEGLNHVEFAQKPFATLRENMEKYERLQAEKQAAMGVRQKEPTLQTGISVRGLTFGYTEGKNIFEDACVDLPAGRFIAITGASGAGKTTFVDLILGLLQPQRGQIFYDDYDLVSHSDAQGRCAANIGAIVSYIPQTVFLNGETVRNNVAFFEDEAQIDDARVEECLRCAQIWDGVQQLPDGVHTLLGENGTAISGGQRQRIALARALYRDFELLVMDEATAALDEKTEMAVIDSIRQLKQGKTLLVVTHHKILADACDLVYEVADQKIVRVK